MIYREELRDSLSYKQDYLDGIERLIAKKQTEAAAEREAYAKDIFSDQEKYRAELVSMLGWPLTEKKDKALPATKSEKLADEENYSIHRMSFEILEGVWMTGLLFKRHTDAPLPMVIAQHGGQGTPERASGIYGSTHNINKMVERILEYEVHAFAPQLLLWNKEQYELGYDRRAIDARLKRVGSSIAAVEIYGITRIIDFFEAQSYVKSFGMVGLSYGGFYTLYTTAVDVRIKSAVSSIFFNNRDAYPWSDWVWQDSARRFDDVEVACLVYPRRLSLQIATKDELFAVENGKKSFETLKRRCEKVGTDWTELIVFEGKHEFCWDNAPIEQLVADLS